jgi:tight adherence protein B
VGLKTASSEVRRRLGALGDGGSPLQVPGRRRVDDALVRLGLPADPRLRVHLAVGAATGVPALLLMTGPALTVLAMVLAALVFGGWRRGARSRQAAADERELPHLLERVARHLRSGASLPQAFAAATPPRPPSGASAHGLAEVWRTVAERSATMGMVAALDEWSEHSRDPARPSIGLAVAALAVAASTGGSPARAVDGVASTLRSRLAVAEEVRALSSQARASATVIALAPVGFGALAAATDDRTAAFLGTPAGVALTLTGLALDAAGAWWMARLCRVRA